MPSVLDSFAQEENFQCSEGMVLVYRINSEKYACLKPSTADRWYQEGIAEPVQQIKSFDGVSELKLQIEALQQKIDQYERDQKIVQTNLALFDELDLVAFNNKDMERIAEIHMPDVKVINRDGTLTEPFDPDHKDEILFLFETFPDFSINSHPIGFGQGNWTAGLSVSTGTFLNPMELPDGTIIEPTGKSFEVTIVTLAYWEDGRIVEEYLMWDNEDWMRQIGIE